ncbi:biotin--[acetyl-CoA-carboxylase] ligase [Odoribacter sp. AF15-53]|uniref:biotin--[acetyl-CoA-carboxylase] ligase n=1 Tax=Odoribacter sp. AF15-53 TaxID=2292236 RepID=UPI000E4F0010|nr:biotin--[acetyl-CoA-carboxylase] ligase [Odoribacter sp. AF15-53]RHR82427.1 biotin--[acetyl-CoA-carboxylase] ligase [Odoribacter sp. AF15-53]
MQEYQVSGFKVREYDELSSTNTEAERVGWGQLEDKMVILTYRQTRGRGQVGNHWECEPGKNISMTVVLRPEGLPAGWQFAVSMVIALGACDFVSRYVKNCTVKWPNDIYVGDRKISGILIEHLIMGPYVGGSLCGIGVNINQEQFLSDAPNPVSLFQLTGEEIPLSRALEELLACIGKRYASILDYEGLERDFLKVLYRGEGRYYWEDERGVFEASIRGINEYGQLVLEDVAGRERVYGFKEVKYL